MFPPRKWNFSNNGRTLKWR